MIFLGTNYKASFIHSFTIEVLENACSELTIMETIENGIFGEGFQLFNTE